MTHHKLRASLALLLVLPGAARLITLHRQTRQVSPTMPQQVVHPTTRRQRSILIFFVKDNGDGTKVIKDVDGTEVTIPVKAERIANTWHANNQVTLALGGADKLVATTHYVSTIPWFKQVYPNISQIPTPVSENNDLNMEELLKTRPDVVLVSTEKQAEQVRQAGLSAVRVGFKDLQGLMRTVNLTAEVLGTEGAYKRAQQYNSYMQGNINKVQDRLKDVP